MPNGKPGDHPYTDIMIHGRDVYSPAIARLVREISALVSEKARRELADLLFLKYNEHSNPDIDKLERVLTKMRDDALREARDRGWET